MSTRWSEGDVPSLEGKTFVVTGSNSGIGFEAARVLARRGGEVVLACRSEARAEAARARILADTPHAKVVWRALDLASLASVRAFAARIADEHAHLDVLVNTAGLMALPRTETADGFEMQLGTNHLGHFALTGLLLPRLRARGAARVVCVCSHAHRWGWMRFDDLMGERRYDKWLAYGQSKLANLLFAFELDRRLSAATPAGPRVEAVACHPGYSATELQGKGAAMENDRFGGWIMDLGNRILAQSAAEGALPTLRAATDPEARGGEYYGPGGLFEMAGPPVKVGTNARARSAEDARTLWAKSVELTGVDFGGL